MSLPRYDKYKESGIPWLESVPSHWEVRTLKRVAKLQSGENITAEKIEQVGEYPVYGGNGLRGFTTAFTHKGRFALIGRQGALCGNVNYSQGKFWASEHAVVATPMSAVNTTWLGELLRAMNLNQYSVSAAQPGLSVELISRIVVPYPPLDEQVAIAIFLNRETTKIDALIAEQEKLIDLVVEKRQAVISNAITKGLNPNAQMKNSGLAWTGPVPAHWDIFRLGALFREIDEPGSDALPVLSVSIHNGVSDKELDEKELDRKVSRSDDKSKYKAVLPGDLTYNMMRAWQGGFGSVTVEGMVSPAYVVARPTAEFLTTHVEYLLRTPQAVAEMKRHSRGITDFRLRLYWEEFKTIKIPLPPKSEQLEIGSFIGHATRRLDSLKAEAERVITLLKERRNVLIAAAVTGQIDVRRAAPLVATESREAIAA
jgi:type I restriction enzyme S subunit